MLATVAAVVAVVSLSIGEVENQERQITVVVTQVPTGLVSSGSPIPNARVEYIEDGADNSTAIASTTDANGSLKLTAGNPGVVTASSPCRTPPAGRCARRETCIYRDTRHLVAALDALAPPEVGVEQVA